MKIEDYTPEQAQRELLELTIKAARRCAYDLDHAAGLIGYEVGPDVCKSMEGRAKLWQGIFNPANGPKDYRSQLHHTITDLQIKVDRLLALCRENKIATPYDDEFPF